VEVACKNVAKRSALQKGFQPLRACAILPYERIERGNVGQNG
jgi:hypothetical protein